MYVVKRNGNKELVKFDKITSRIQKLLNGIENIDAALITQKICNRIYSGITTTELDKLLAFAAPNFPGSNESPKRPWQVFRASLA